MGKFTKGEWRVVAGKYYASVRCDDKVISDMRMVNQNYDKANAHLIAAAPEMYEMLVKARRELDYLDECVYDAQGCSDTWKEIEILEEIDKLLAKARGE